MRKVFSLVLFLMPIFLILPSAHATLIFSDDFSTDKGWGNQRGNWGINGSVYDAQSPNNLPPTYSSAPTPALTDFTVEIDVTAVSDGGIWLRSSYTGGMVSGLLLVTGGYCGSNQGIYWHEVQNDSYSSPLPGAVIPGLLGSNAHFKVEAVGDTYKVYLNGEAGPIATLVNNTFTSGSVGVYDFSSQTFDNVTIYNSTPIPEPATMLLLGSGLIGLVGYGRKKFFKK